MRIPQEERSWVTTGEAAELLQVDVSTIMQWADRGYLDATRLPSGHRRITKASVERVKAGTP